MRLFLRFCGFLFAAGTIVFLVSIGAGAGLLWHFSKDLPDYSQLQDYEPPVMTRVHATDGALVAEYATQRRLYIPIQAVPKMVINAFLAAEDKNFYEHNGLDFQGIARAGTVYLQNYGSSRRPQGASTITQQVAKNFLLTNEVSFTRKIKEALLALKIERTYSKDKILELYLNEIYLGFSAYGIAAASLMYFDKSVHELTIPEAAYLAALPKAPSILHPFRARERAIERRNYVIDQMVLTGVVKQADADKFKKEPLTVTARPTGSHIFAADYFAEEVRRWIYEKYGEKTLYEGGLSVRTTLDPKLQVQARTALVDGLIKFDEAQGWRGPVQKLKPEGDWGVKLAEVKQLNDIAPWRLSVVLATSDQSATVGLYPPREPGGALSKERATGVVPLDAVKWAKAAEGPTRGRVPARVNQVLEVGDVVYVEPLNKEANTWRLRQVPEVSGAMVAMDPWTGRVLAMVGGFSFDQSQFNRATQAMRQPGSSFKPFVYAAALDNGYTPSTVVMDAPIEIDQGPGVPPWRPENYSTGKYYGPSTLRTGIELSRNTMTVRLAQDVGMPLIAEYARRFGVYDSLPTFLSYSLGAGETTVMRMVCRLFDVRQRRPAHRADLHRPHPGPLRPHRLQARLAGVPRLQRQAMGEPAGADAGRQARSGDRSDDRLPDHLDDGRRGAARHRDRAQAGRQADRRQDRHHQRREGRVVRRFLAGHRGRRLSRLRQAAPARQPRDRRRRRRADRRRVPERGAQGQAGGAVPRAGRHQAHPHRRPLRHAAGRRRGPRDPGSVQARHRAAGQLFGDRLHAGHRQQSRSRVRTARRRAGLHRATAEPPDPLGPRRVVLT